MSTTAIFLLVILGLGFVITFQIAKASEYVSVLKGEKKSFEQSNKINAFLMVVFLVLGLIGIWWCHDLLYHKTLMPFPSASDHGENVDNMLRITFLVTGIVFFVTQILLFWFAYKYQYHEKRKAYYYPHNNTLEIIWTTIPTIVLCVLVGFGLFYWYEMTGPAPKGAAQVEITGRQFNWIYRYPGKDNTFGKKYFRNISDIENNTLGLIWEDVNSHDDIVSTEAIYLVKDEPVELIINSRDVLHSVGLPHFRLKMDAVPGIPTRLTFTPKYTTDEMKEITGNPNFEYEIACDQMCGNSHYSMKGIIKVVKRDEFILWRAKQKTNYQLVFPEGNQPAEQPPAQADSTANTVASTR